MARGDGPLANLGDKLSDITGNIFDRGYDSELRSGGGGDSESSNRILYGTYYRTISGGSATHIGGDAEGISQLYNAGERTQAPLNMSMLDSPSTTSAITYQIYIRSNSGQVSYNNNEGSAKFTAFEIAG